MPPITVVRSMPGIPSLMNHLPHSYIHVSQTDLRLATQGSAAPVMINNRGMSWDLLIKSTEQRTNQDRERVTSFDSQAHTYTTTRQMESCEGGWTCTHPSSLPANSDLITLISCPFSWLNRTAVAAAAAAKECFCGWFVRQFFSVCRLQCGGTQT